MKTAEQIAEEFIENLRWPGSKADMIEALKEYGEAVRQKAAGVCEAVYPKASYASENSDMYQIQDATVAKCKAAIERMELP